MCGREIYLAISNLHQMPSEPPVSGHLHIVLLGSEALAITHDNRTTQYAGHNTYADIRYIRPSTFDT